jgi:hypothetical protein
MYDLKWIRESPEGFDAGLTRRGLAPRSAEVLDLDARHRALLTRLQEMQARRNEASRAIGEAKRKGEDAEALLAEVAGLKDQLSDAEDQARALSQALDDAPTGSSGWWAIGRTSNSKPSSISSWPAGCWISRPRPSCPARASWCCAAPWPACTGRWASS